MNQDKPVNPAPSGLSSLFGKIKDAVFEEEPKAATPPKSSAAVQPSAASEFPGAVAPVVSAVPVANPMIEHMMQVVMGKTTAYTALVEAISPLEAFIPDEESRFKAAFSIVGKTRSVEQIVQAIDMQHSQALDAEVQSFNVQAQNREGQEITSRLRDIQDLRAQVESGNQEAARFRKQLEQKIQELEESATANTQKIAQMEREVAAQREEMASVNRQFNEAVSVVKDRLLQARAKVLRYLAA